jgi:2-keto-4-pentenoate hydratase/2-oxohepta-3-ene-1,7-dioic acid hydratase in catechol pathway
MVTADEIPDPSALELTTRVNGDVRQHAKTELLINDVPALIEYLSSFTELLPGDVIATGTPGGVGDSQEPQRYLRQGDVVEVTVDGVGTLRNPVRLES